MAALAEYLKKYTSDAGPSVKQKKKKEKRKGLRDTSGGLRIVDADVVWQKDTRHDSEDDEEEAPVVEESAEVKGLQQLERAKMHRPYLTIGEDGSGWVTVDEPETLPGENNSASPDLSPPRKHPASTRSIDSPPRRRQRHDSQDLSPPRRGDRGGDSDSDLSPPRRSKRNPHTSPTPRSQNQDLSPPRKSKQDNDLSPPRRRNVPISESQHGDTDLSPPHKQQQGRGERGRGSVPPPPPPPARMSDGTLAGLRSGSEVGEEMRLKREEDRARFRAMDAGVTGRGAGTIYRDKQGKQSSLDAIMEEERARKKKDLPPPVWGKGLAQQRKAKEEARKEEMEGDLPFAQYRDDPRLDAHLKAAVRWGDPMAHLVKDPGVQLADLSENAMLVESGFKIPQDIPPHSWIKRRVQAPLNRWGIKPGRHWDGVDRSTGFEKEAFLRKNETEAMEKEAYTWSVADM